MSPTEQNARRLPQNAKGRKAPQGFAYPGGKAGEATGSGPPKRGLKSYSFPSTRVGRTGTGGGGCCCFVSRVITEVGETLRRGE